MSYESHQLETIESLHSDFDTFLSQRKWSEARAVIDNTGDLGYEMEALNMHKSLNRAESQERIEAEDEAQGEYDADNYRPEYPKE